MNKILKFFYKYWLCFLLSLIMVVGLFLSGVFADVYEHGSGMISLDLEAICLIFVQPIYAFIYGCLTYAIVKKVLIPQFCLMAVAFLYWFGLDLGNLFWLGTYIHTLYPVVFSILGTGITAYVCYLKNSLKE